MSETCDTCKHNGLPWYEEPCDSCCGAHDGYEQKSDYISRQAAIDEIYHHFPSLSHQEAAMVLHTVPTADVVPRSIFEQVKWERDVAMKQLKDLGIGFGEEVKDVVEVVRKPIEGYEGYYEVDQFGRVYAVDRTIRVNDNGRVYDKPLAGKQLKQSMHTKGYKTVALTKDGKTKTHYVHRLIAEAFIPNPDKLPCINHKDEDKTNNFVENLEWCTHAYNNSYGTAIKRANKKKVGKKHTEEHNRKISESMKRYFAERRTDER